MGLLMQFLVEQGAFLQDAAARRQNSDEALVQSKLKGATGKPWAADLQAFDTALAQRQKPLECTKSQVLSFCCHCPVDCRQGGTRNATQAGSSRCTSAKQARPARITDPLLVALGEPARDAPEGARQAHGTQTISAAASAVRKAIDGCIAGKPPRPTELSLTATLLAHLLNVPLTQILQLRHQDVDWATGLQMRLKDRWMEVPQEVGAFVRSAAVTRTLGGSDFNPWVFPGRLISDCLSTSAVSYHLRKYEIPTNRKQARH